MSRKYFEAIGRQAASLGRGWPYVTLRAPQWAQDAARDGWEHQQRKSWRAFQKPKRNGKGEPDSTKEVSR